MCGIQSDTALDLIREMIGDRGIGVGGVLNGGHSALHADVELDGEKMSVCYVRNADGPERSRIAVNFNMGVPSRTLDDTDRYSRACTARQTDSRNLYIGGMLRIGGDALLSESDRRLLEAKELYRMLYSATMRGDDRPIFIYGLFDRIDESVSLRRYLDALSDLDRQVFISTAETSDSERLKHRAAMSVRVNSF
jgi:hypothetical protein